MAYGGRTDRPGPQAYREAVQAAAPGRFGQEVGGALVESSVQTWQPCMDACNRCAQACDECLNSCLKEPDVQARVRCIQILRDCSDICTLSARYMSRGSQFAPTLCRLCADICEACAAECARFQDHHCQECARYCRDCAEQCRQMVAQAAG